MRMEKPKQTRECSLQELRSDLARVIQTQLSDEEQILVCYETTGTIGDTSLIFERQLPVYSAQIISTKQLIHGSSYLGSIGNTSIQLKDIVSVGEEHYNNGYWVHTRGPGDIHIACEFASLQASQNFVRILKDAIKQEKNVSVKAPPEKIEERLQTLTRLYKNGLINESEFQQKRKELLDQL